MSREERAIYNKFALDLTSGVDVIDRDSFEVIIDSRRKKLLTRWLVGKTGFFLDYGCGDGRFSRFINKHLNRDVVALDVSQGMVKYASEQGKGINYLVADCHKLPFRNECFDAVLGMGIFHHLNLRTALSECKRILRPHGFLVAFEPNSLGFVSFIARKAFKTRMHTPRERPYNSWLFAAETKRNGFAIVDTQFLSFLGFVFPFIWATNIAHMFSVFKTRVNFLKRFDQLIEKIPVFKRFCWLFGCKCVLE